MLMCIHASCMITDYWPITGDICFDQNYIVEELDALNMQEYIT